MIAPITAPGIYPAIPAETYHTDPCVEISLSSSIAKELLSRSPKHAWQKHPRLGGKPQDGEEEVDPKVSKEMEKGTLIHRLMLGRGGDIEVCPFDNWRKDAAKAQRDVAKLKGRIPTLPHLMEAAQQAADAARQQLDAMGLDYVFRHGSNEVVIVWREPNGAWCRAMVDNLIVDEASKTAEIWDIKTTGKSSHPEACGTQIGNLGYDLSLAFHERGLIALRPDLAGRVQKRWVFVETNPPYAATPISISAEWEMAGAHRTEQAIAKWQKSVSEGRWPYYVGEVTRIEPKPWQIASAFLDE